MESAWRALSRLNRCKRASSGDDCQLERNNKKVLSSPKEARKLGPAGADASFPARILDYVLAEATARRFALSGSGLKRFTVSKIIVWLPFAIRPTTSPSIVVINGCLATGN